MNTASIIAQMLGNNVLSTALHYGGLTNIKWLFGYAAIANVWALAIGWRIRPIEENELGQATHLP